MLQPWHKCRQRQRACDRKETRWSYPQRYGYTYDPAGNRTAEQIDDNVTLATHDNLNRLLTHQAGGTITFKGTVDETATVTVGGKPATVKPDNTWQAPVVLNAGTNRVTITATDSSGNTATAEYDVDVTGTTKTFTYDANGNMTGDGTRTFEWDAMNQLVAVKIGTHRKELTYDGIRRRVSVVERENGTVDSDVRAVWCQKTICEERNLQGGAVTRRSEARGEHLGGLSRFFAVDHLGSVTDVTDGSAALVGPDPFRWTG